MIDINKTLDLIKLRFYNEWLYSSHLYDEGEGKFHKTMTEEVVKTYIDPLNLPKDSKIIDMGCGAGYFLDEMKTRGYTNLMGITLAPHDVKTAREKGHIIKEYDFTFLPQKDGFEDESVDFIFMRQALEHSPYPIFTLMEYNRLLKLHSKIYIEVPAPECELRHEFNVNHYSILGPAMISALLVRTGFKITNFNDIEFEVTVEKEGKEPRKAKEKYFCILAQKRMPLDIK